MTATQLAFAFFVFIATPGFGVCGALLYRPLKNGWIHGFLAASALSIFGLALSASLAVCLYPDYPAEGPPEFLSMFFVLPGYFFGFLGLLFLKRFPPHTDQRPDLKLPKILLSAGVLLSLALTTALYFVVVQPEHRALPWSARQIQEYYWSETLLPDFQYCLKARISEDEFKTYVSKLGLITLTEKRVNEGQAPSLAWPRSFTDDDLNWWNPPGIQKGKTYVHQSGDTWVFASYEKGWLYVAAYNH